MFIDGYKTQGGSLGILESMIAGSDELSTAQRAQLLDVVPEPSIVGIAAARSQCSQRTQATTIAIVYVLAPKSRK